MSTTQEKIQLLEQDAKDLVANLKEIQEHAGKYKDAKDELNKVSNTLQTFINETKSLSQESHNIISRLDEIGAAKLLDGLSSIKQNQQKIFKLIHDNDLKTVKNFKSMKTLIIAGLALVLILEIVISLKLFLII